MPWVSRIGRDVPGVFITRAYIAAVSFRFGGLRGSGSEGCGLSGFEWALGCGAVLAGCHDRAHIHACMHASFYIIFGELWASGLWASMARFWAGPETCGLRHFLCREYIKLARI